MNNQKYEFHTHTLPVNDRVARLRQRLVETRPEIFVERALLVTDAYRETENSPVVLRRAWTLKRILEHSRIDIKADERIVGCKTPLPKGSPLYPEFSVKWLEDELGALSSRAETPFDVSETTKKAIRESVIPYWKGRTVYDGIVKKAPAPALAAAREGLLFHYYMDRSIGHITVNYEKVLKIGLFGLKAEINDHLARLSPAQNDFSQKKNFYEALLTVADAAITFAHRHAALASELADQCDDIVRCEELKKIARICRRVPEHPAGSFPEALQSFWFVHLILNLESNGYAISPGRFCQYIYPYYQADIDKGAIDEPEAQEWLNCLWIKFNELTVAKAGATAKASNTYVDFQNLNIGGLMADGRDGTNAVSYLCLNAHDTLRLTQPQLSCMISSKTDKAFLMRACEVVREGTGMPSMFNDDVKVISLLASGKPLADARSGGVNGCVEVNAQGCDNMASTGYVNLPKCLELAMNDGVSMTTGKPLGPQTGNVTDFETFEELWSAFSTQLEAAVSLKVAYDQAAKKVFAEVCPVVFTSLVMDDCIEKGLDFHQGGARYNAPMMCGVGLGTLSDSLASIREFCFTTGQYSLMQIREAMAENFASQSLLQKQLWNKAPKFGNNDDRADSIARRIVKRFSDILSTHTNAHGEVYRANMIPTTNHIPMGHATAATPDGRFAGAPLSEGVSPVQGQDASGPTGVILSLAKVDHASTAGTLLNMKFTPTILAGEEQLEKFSELIRTYFAQGGYHMQFNVVSTETLLAAQKDPQAYRSLIVRVAGYSDYFVTLSKDVQDEIIMRTAHGA
jgi:pyruvate formate-lyase/glycerol dehydratase family glycyl radical enzyme